MNSTTLRLFSLAEQCHTQNFYLRCFKSDFDAVKSKFGLLIELFEMATSKWRQSQNWRQPQNEHDLKNGDNLKHEDDLKNEEDLKNDDNIIIQDITWPELTQP